MFDMEELAYNIFMSALAGIVVAMFCSLMLFFVALITHQFYLIEPPIMKYVLNGVSSVTFIICFIHMQKKSKQSKRGD